jgi:ABC-type uncharacterized transport system involved in gliding motility auxiliary subunit
MAKPNDTKSKKPYTMKWTRQQWAEIALSLGVALLVSAAIRYSIQGELMRLSEILLIAGGVLTTAGIVLAWGRIRGYFSRRSSQLGTNTLILTLGVLAILFVVNYLGQAHHKRFDLTSEKLYTLSDQTSKVVRGLTKDVNIVRFAKSQDQDLNDLMSEYKNLSPHIKFQNVDPQQKPEVAKQYGATRMGQVVVASGPRTETVEPAPASAMSGGEDKFSEEDITSAIIKVTRNKVKTVCFVTGHGEKSVTDQGAEGFTLADSGLKKENYNTKTVNLVTSNGVPSDCDVTVVAGPTQAYFPQETQMLVKYLDNGGKLFIMIDPDKDAKLQDIYNAWNIKVGDNYVIDASGMGQLLGAGPAIPLVVDYGTSPITENLQRHMTFFPLARTVTIADNSKPEPQDVELLKTSPASFTTPKLEHQVSYNPKTDTKGPLSLGVAGENKAGDKDPRLVVIGNSIFASNQGINQAGSNGDLFFNVIDWLAKDENLISIRPKSATNRRVAMTQAQSNALWWISLLLLPGAVIFAGIFIWWKRR